MALDPIRNHAIVTVSLGYSASATSIVLASGHGAYLPDPATEGAFNLVWWNSTDYKNPSLDPNKEIVRVTARTSDTLTVARPAVGNSYNGEGSANTASAKNIVQRIYKMVLTPTRKYMDDIQAELSNRARVVTVGPVDADYITDGTADDVQIQAALDYVHTNSLGKVHVNGSSTAYDIAARLIVYSNSILEGDGFSTHLRLANGVDTVMVRNSDTSGGNSNIEIRQIYLDGNDANQTLQVDLVSLLKVNNCTIEDCYVSNSKWAHITIDSASHKNIVRNNSVTGGNGHGILISNGSYGNIVEGNQVHDIGIDGGINFGSGSVYGYGIYFYKASERNIAKGNVILDMNGHGIALDQNGAAGGIKSIVSNNIIKNCGIVNTGTRSHMGIYCKASADNIIANNIIEAASVYGIDVRDCTGIEVIGNSVSLTEQHGIYIQNSQSCVFSANRSYNNGQKTVNTYSGIYIANAAGTETTRYNKISGNYCYDNQGTQTQKSGIYETNTTAAPSQESNFNQISDNFCYNNIGTDLVVSGADNLVYGNRTSTSESSNGFVVIQNGSAQGIFVDSASTTNYGLFVNVAGNRGMNVTTAGNAGGGALSVQKQGTGNGFAVSIVNSGTGAALNINNASTGFAILVNAGRTGLLQATPTAYLHLGAGTVTASTAPLKFTSGTNLTSAEAGAVEFDGTRLYVTSSVPTRQTLAFFTDKLSVFAATTSAELAGVVSDETGSGALVFANTPTLVTPVLGVATATSINKLTITAPATSAVLTIADGKTLTASNTLTFTGTDSSSIAFGAGGTVAFVADKLSVFAATTSAELAGVISDETGTGVLVFGTAPTLTTSVTVPLVIGGTGTTSPLTFRTTSNAGGTTGADFIFQSGNNGATELVRIMNSGLVGIGTAAPTHTLTLASTSTGFVAYNTADQVTNYDRIIMGWAIVSANVFSITTQKAGTGTVRQLALGTSNRQQLQFNDSASTTNGFAHLAASTSTTNISFFTTAYSSSASSGAVVLMAVLGTISQSSTAGYTALHMNITESSTGSGTKRLVDVQVGGADKFVIDNSGNVILGAAAAGATAAQNLALSNTATAPSASANLVHLYAVDVSASAVLGIYQETAPAVAASVLSTHKVQVVINGTSYFILLSNV